MITIVCSERQERGALVTLCESRGWPVMGFDRLRTFYRHTSSRSSGVVVIRRRVEDGYSDDLLSTLQSSCLRTRSRVIVLAPASLQSVEEARQLALGADCVLRDPVRAEVLAAYIAKLRGVATHPVPPAEGEPRRPMHLAGGTFDPTERTLRHKETCVQLTPRETELARLLLDRAGEIVSYDELYDHLLNRRFGGDTSNMRVLLGKLIASAARVGVPLRDAIRVIPKTGYCYRGD